MPDSDFRKRRRESNLAHYNRRIKGNVEARYKRTTALKKWRLTKPWGQPISAARSRCKKSGEACDIDAAWGEKIWTGKCALTGIEFEYITDAGGPSPLACSLDKIDPEKGYTKENCRFILFCLNAFKGRHLTDDALREIARRLLNAEA